MEIDARETFDQIHIDLEYALHQPKFCKSKIDSKVDLSKNYTDLSLI